MASKGGNVQAPTRRPVDLLWTGGWDSTFRLLQLVLVERRSVQPHYLIDAGRPSTGAELTAMDNIRRSLPESAAAMIAPTTFRTVSSLPRNEQIEAAYNNILERYFLGAQYEWLPRYCEWADIQDMELSIHVDDTAHTALKSRVVRDREAYILDEDLEGHPIYRLFGSFRFPILDISKKDMEAVAAEHGFESIMEETWFCHQPRNGKPCGVCNPCIYTIEEGMAKRVPIKSRIRYRLRVTPRLKSIIQKHKHPRLYRIAKAVQSWLE